MHASEFAEFLAVLFLQFLLISTSLCWRSAGVVNFGSSFVCLRLSLSIQLKYAEEVGKKREQLFPPVSWKSLHWQELATASAPVSSPLQPDVATNSSYPGPTPSRNGFLLAIRETQAKLSSTGLEAEARGFEL